jgi:hypothetical protein
MSTSAYYYHSKCCEILSVERLLGVGVVAFSLGHGLVHLHDYNPASYTPNIPNGIVQSLATPLDREINSLDVNIKLIRDVAGTTSIARSIASAPSVSPSEALWLSLNWRDPSSYDSW